VYRETSDIKGHLVETKTSRSQVENATSYIEHHQSPSNREKVWSQIGNFAWIITARGIRPQPRGLTVQ
jgi:hypothetical protein